jgi:hypothetical protein
MVMRLSPKQIKDLQALLKDQTGKDYTDEEAQQAGLAIMRFVYAKESRKVPSGQEPKQKGSPNEEP